MQKKLLQACLKNSLGLFFIIIGSFSWSLVLVRSGLYYKNINGTGFWGPHGHDAIWHIAVINSISKFSLELPIYANQNLINYHFVFDLLVAIVHKFTLIPVSFLYFQIFPVIFSLLIGLLVYNFVYIVVKDRFAASLSVFFVYFGGNFAWILSKGESTFWSQQSISTLVNPPFALSLIFLLLGLILLKKEKLNWSSVFFGILIQTKAYIGVLSLISLLLVGLYQICCLKKTNIFKVFSTAFFVSTLVSLPFLTNQKFFIFHPFWFLETMMAANDRLYWPKFAEAIYNYKLSFNYLKLSLAYIVAFAIFLIGNMGFRVVSLFFLFNKKIYKKIDIVLFVCFLITLGGVVAPLIFIQAATPWNTIQFFYYSLFFSSVFTGIFLSKLNKIIVIVILVFTLPTTFISLKNYYLTQLPASKISANELVALKFLKNQQRGIVLTYPFSLEMAKQADTSKPRDLFVYETTAYVSAFSECLL